MRLLVSIFLFNLVCISNVLVAQTNVGVVINELMADNASAVMDEAGDFDDWIELYNNLDVPMNLSGYGLSDDESELGKFIIPDGTTIEENGYLIIWADDDQKQGPLHAQFKLSAGGEALFLTDPANNIIDQIVFEEQVEDMSLAREPNGTGPFVIKPHSFNTDNDIDVSTLSAIPVSVSFFPNPTRDLLRIDLGAIAHGKRISLINLEGKVAIETVANSSILDLDMSALSHGNYILQIEGYQGTLIQKVD